MLKKVLIHTRRSVKIIILSMIAAFLIIGAIAFLYKPTYAVYIKGEQVGYTEDRGNLQRKINNYIEKIYKRHKFNDAKTMERYNEIFNIAMEYVKKEIM